MSKVDVQIVYLPHRKDTGSLKYVHDGDSGMDLYAGIEEPVVLHPGERKIIPSGVKMLCPKGTELQVRPRGGTALKGLTVANTPGTVDAGYTGEIGIIAYNISDKDFTVNPGDRIAQVVLCPVLEMNLVRVDELGDTSRGEGAYNSTGTK